MSRKKKGSGLFLPVFILIAAVIASIVIIAYTVFTGNGVNSNPVSQKVNREVTKKAVEVVIQKETGSNITINEIKEKMTEDDAEEFDGIVNKYADDGILSEALEIYNANNGDIRATADALKDKVCKEDMARLYELYEKYGTEALNK